MKVWLVYNISPSFPFNVLADTIKVFDSYDKMYNYISNYYDTIVSGEEERIELAQMNDNSSWEEYKKEQITINENEIQWAEAELE